MTTYDSVKLLKKIHQNCATAMDAISVLLPKASDDAFSQQLIEQQQKYRAISSEAFMLLSGYRELPPDGVFSHLGTWSVLTMSTITNRETSNMARVLSEGAEGGIIELTHMLNSGDPDDHSRDLAQRLIYLEDETLTQMKGWL